MSQERILGQILLGTLTKKLRGFLKPKTPQNVTLASIVKKHDQKKFNWWDAITRWEGPVLATLIIGGLANLTIQVYMAERYDDITRKLYLWNHFYKLYLENLDYCEYLQARKLIWENRLQNVSQQVFEMEKAEETARLDFRQKISIVQGQCPLAIDLMDFKVIFKNQNKNNNIQTYKIHGFGNSSNLSNFKFQFLQGQGQGQGQTRKFWCVNGLKKLAISKRKLRYVQEQELYTRQKFETVVQQVAELHHELLTSLQQQQKYLQILRFLGNQGARQHQLGINWSMPIIFQQYLQQYFQDFQVNYNMGCWFQEEGLDKIEAEFEELENLSLQDLIEQDE